MKRLATGLILGATLAISSLATTEAQAATSKPVYVTVHRGNTLSGIAYAHHTTWRHLATLNHLRNANLIYPGERLLISGSGSTPKPPAHKPPVHKPPVHKPHPSSTLNSRVLYYGAKLRGVRYVYGGTTPRGMDCSGFTRYVYREAGRAIPRVASDQYRASHHEQTPHPGDLVFVHSGGYVYHVAIYVNSRTWLEAEEPGRGVNYYRPWSHSVYYGHF